MSETPRYNMFVINPDLRSTNCSTNHSPGTPCIQSYNSHPISELSALPRSPEDVLTPSHLDSFQRRSKRYTGDNHDDAPCSSKFSIQDAHAHFIAQQNWDISELSHQRSFDTQQRALDKKAIARLEEERVSQAMYIKQREENTRSIQTCWSRSVEEVSRLQRCREELEKQVDDSHAREEALRRQNETLAAEIGRMERSIAASAAGEEHSRSCLTEAQASIEESRIEIARFSDLLAESSCRESDRGLLLAILLMIVVAVEMGASRE